MIDSSRQIFNLRLARDLTRVTCELTSDLRLKTSVLLASILVNKTKVNPVEMINCSVTSVILMQLLEPIVLMRVDIPIP
jgi:hypothetical protein